VKIQGEETVLLGLFGSTGRRHCRGEFRSNPELCNRRIAGSGKLGGRRLYSRHLPYRRCGAVQRCIQPGDNHRMYRLNPVTDRTHRRQEPRKDRR
jgi:hypothetical protein